MSDLAPSTRLIQSVADAALVSLSDMTGPCRRRRLARARWAAMRALRARGWSTTRIGDKLGGRDHTTVMHGLIRSDELYASDPDFAWLCDKVATL